MIEGLISPVRATQVILVIDLLLRPFRALWIFDPNPGLAPISAKISQMFCSDENIEYRTAEYRTAEVKKHLEIRHSLFDIRHFSGINHSFLFYLSAYGLAPWAVLSGPFRAGNEFRDRN
jgi:hypothetical protein